MKSLVIALGLLLAVPAFAESDPNSPDGYLVTVKSNLSGKAFTKCLKDLQQLTWDYQRQGWVVPMSIVVADPLIIHLDVTAEGALAAQNVSCVEAVGENGQVDPLPSLGRGN